MIRRVHTLSLFQVLSQKPESSARAVVTCFWGASPETDIYTRDRHLVADKRLQRSLKTNASLVHELSRLQVYVNAHASTKPEHDLYFEHMSEVHTPLWLFGYVQSIEEASSCDLSYIATGEW